MPISLHTDRRIIDRACTMLGLPGGAACIVTWTTEEERPAALAMAIRRGATVELRGRAAVAYRRMGGLP